MKQIPEIVRGIVIFAAGAVAGILASRSYFQKQADEIVNEEIAEMKGYYEDQARRSFSSMYEEVEEGEEYDIKSGDNRYWRKVEKPPIESILTSEMPGYQTESKALYLIDGDEFRNESPVFDKETLFYYLEDGTLTDSDEEVVAVPSNLVGDHLDAFEDDEVAAIYIRNHETEADYEVLAINGSFAETEEPGDDDSDEEEERRNVFDGEDEEPNDG